MKLLLSSPLLRTSSAYMGRHTLPFLPAQHIHAVPENRVEEHTSSVHQITGQGLNWVSLELYVREREERRERERERERERKSVCDRLCPQTRNT